METIKDKNNKINIEYELFILALSFLSIANIVFSLVIDNQQLESVLFIIDLILSLVFFIDFNRRLFSTKSKKGYFFKNYGWLDLISSIPYGLFKLARIVRIVRASRAIKKFGFKNMLKEMKGNEAASAMYTVIILVILVIEFGSLGILFTEQKSAGANIVTANDAIWWSLVTISTVGYGDRYPTTNQGRLIATLVIIIGVGLFGVVTGFLAKRFLKENIEEIEEGENYHDQLDHIEHMLEELKKHEEDQKKDIKKFKSKLTKKK